MKQGIRNGNSNIQITGNGNKIIQNSQGFRADPSNPNLITCPHCGNYQVSRSADQCPVCNYSFRAARQAAIEEARRDLGYSMNVTLVLALGSLALAFTIGGKFHIGFIKSVLTALSVVMLVYACSLQIKARVATKLWVWRNRRQRGAGKTGNGFQF
jgi:ribosomal protein L37AE/L43A